MDSSTPTAPRDRPVIVSDMVEAGVDAFRDWFRNPIFADSLLEIPDYSAISALAEAMFLSMMARRPVS